MRYVKVFFDDPARNYSTAVSESVTASDVTQYWLGKWFVRYDERTMDKVIAVEFEGVRYDL